MQEEDALDFYNRITSGTKRHKTISLEHSSGSVLEKVEMHPVDKRTLASVIEQLPDEMFEAVDQAENAEEAEQQLEEEGNGLGAVTAETVDAFETLCAESLDHPKLDKPKMDHIVSELDFEVLFELGTEIINYSSEETGAIRGFQKQG
jgi:hypothetical protein